MKLNRHNLFTETWRWRHSDIELILDTIKNLPRPVFHICSGNSSIGDIRLDRCKVILDKRKSDYEIYRGSATVLGNMLQLPFKSSVAATVICDPPYDPKWLLNGVYKELIYEISRILKPAGYHVLLHSEVLTSPVLKLVSMKAVDTGKDNHYYKILSVSQKVNSQISDYE